MQTIDKITNDFLCRVLSVSLQQTFKVKAAAILLRLQQLPPFAEASEDSIELCDEAFKIIEAA